MKMSTKTDSEKLRFLANYFDELDKYNSTPPIDNEVQRDLRRIADRLDEYEAEHV